MSPRGVGSRLWRHASVAKEGFRSSISFYTTLSLLPSCRVPRSVGDAPSFGGSANASGATAVKRQDMGMMRVKYLENSPFQQGENESSDGCRDMWRWWLPR